MPTDATRSRSSDRDKPAPIVARIIAGTALIVAVGAGFELRRDIAVAQSQDRLQEQGLTLGRHDPLAPPDPSVLVDTTPRALVHDALLLARAANAERSAQRRSSLLSAASSRIARAELGRPNWGEALAVDAYIRSLDKGPADAAALRMLASSYDNAPFLRDLGQWRARYALALWQELPASTQTRAVNEAVWLARLSLQLRPTLFTDARASGAYSLFMRRWLELRRGDGDFSAGQRPSPQ